MKFKVRRLDYWFISDGTSQYLWKDGTVHKVTYETPESLKYENQGCWYSKEEAKRFLTEYERVEMKREAFELGSMSYYYVKLRGSGSYLTKGGSGSYLTKEGKIENWCDLVTRVKHLEANRLCKFDSYEAQEEAITEYLKENKMSEASVKLEQVQKDIALLKTELDKLAKQVEDEKVVPIKAGDVVQYYSNQPKFVVSIDGKLYTIDTYGRICCREEYNHTWKTYKKIGTIKDFIKG